MGLCGRAIVELEHAAEPLPASDGASSECRCLGRAQRMAQTLVGPFLMIMVDKRAHGGSHVRFSERYHARQTLGPGRANKSFRERIQIRTPSGQAHEVHATGLQQIPEGGSVERVSVEDYVLHVPKEAVVRVREVPGHLCHPRFVRVTRDASDLHRAGLERHHEEDDVANQSAPGEHFDGEKVRGRQAIPMSGQKCLPGRVRAALWAGSMPWFLRMS